MVWRRLWPLLSTVIFLTIVQKSVCFRIKYESDGRSEVNNNPATTIDETQTNPGNSESDKRKFEDSNNGPEKEPDSNSNIQSENSEPKIISENVNNTAKLSPAEVFKGIGRNPAIRKLVEKGDPQLFEKFFIDYVKTSQPDTAEIGSDSQINKPDIESDKSVADNQVEKKLAQPEYTKSVIATSKTNENLTVEVPKQLTKQKEDNKIMNAAKALPPPLDESSKYLNAASLTQMTQSIGKGEAVSVECDFPHLDIYSRCFANVMEVTVTSRSALLGRISFQEAQGHIDMNGNDVTLYAVYGMKSTTGFMWRLQKGVTVDDVDVGCKTCHTLDLRMMVLVMEDLEDKNKRCVIDLTCTQPNMLDQPRKGNSQVSQNELSQESIVPEATSRVHSAKTTLNILKGTMMESEVLPQDHYAVELGTKLGLLISAYTKDITLDLHIQNCEARGEDGRGIILIKDGCSAHHMMSEFHEILGVVHDPEIDDHHVVRVTQHTTFQVFNFSPKPQTIAIICKIKMCGGECDERPGCVNSEVNLSRRKQKSITVFHEEVVLGQMLNVAGLPEGFGASKNLDLLSNIIEPEEEAFIQVKVGEDQTIDIHANCIPRSVFYISLGVLGGVFLLLLVIGLYFSKAIMLPRLSSSYKINIDEVESPNRAYYQEYSSPRRRSPGSKSPDQQPILNKIVYS